MLNKDNVLETRWFEEAKIIQYYRGYYFGGWEDARWAD